MKEEITSPTSKAMSSTLASKCIANAAEPSSAKTTTKIIEGLKNIGTIFRSGSRSPVKKDNNMKENAENDTDKL